MADLDLEEIRNQRLAQLQAQNRGNNANNQEVLKEKQQHEDMRNAILSQVLDQSARARLSTLSLGKPEKGKMVENMIVSMAQKGQLMGRLGEKELINILESINKQTSKKSVSVKFDRRRAALDIDDDL
ncbi:PREDICTED: programmed cell death protein 5 [Ceratosolen solmsi marchali]|uniref:Programmed cell death protein 5 n=1 Tax=Ceratosolen solmsi marchali TaxID=326594 RepID=A0AAJ6YV47_9HYME|nr:PREDICTED: programmed cell death protein 5 [Ceratosolen solmsi marchali]